MHDYYYLISKGPNSDEASIRHSINILPECKTKQDMSYILLNPERRKVYNRCWCTLNIIGHLRGNLWIDQKTNWVTRNNDFTKEKISKNIKNVQDNLSEQVEKILKARAPHSKQETKDQNNNFTSSVKRNNFSKTQQNAPNKISDLIIPTLIPVLFVILITNLLFQKDTVQPTQQAQLTQQAQPAPARSMSSYEAYQIGQMYETGNGKEKNYALALAYYHEAASQGHAAAHGRLGIMYLTGKGIAKNEFEAFTWFKKGAEIGDSFAAGALGWMYEVGKGTAQNYSFAFSWYERASHLGNTKAMVAMGDMFAKGRGVSRNRAKAVFWYDLATMLLDKDAKQRLKAILASYKYSRPLFSDYLVNLYQGQMLLPKEIKYDGDIWIYQEDEWIEGGYRRIIADPEVNFAGKFFLFTLGLGTDSAAQLMVDLSTGQFNFASQKFDYTLDDESLSMKFGNKRYNYKTTIINFKESRLLLVQYRPFIYGEDYEKIKNICKERYYRINDQGDFLPVGNIHSMCIDNPTW